MSFCNPLMSVCRRREILPDQAAKFDLCKRRSRINSPSAHRKSREAVAISAKPSSETNLNVTPHSGMSPDDSKNIRPRTWREQVEGSS